MKFRIQDGHAHASTLFDIVSWKHYVALLNSFLICLVLRPKSLTTHIPLELQHVEMRFHYTPDGLVKALRFVRFGEYLKRLTGIKLYWENAPLLKVGTWDLKYKNPVITSFDFMPLDAELCLDTGHAMLGYSSKETARAIIYGVLSLYGSMIKHLHIHENDLVHDKHWNPRDIHPLKRVLTKPILEKLMKDRSYIFEKGG